MRTLATRPVTPPTEQLEAEFASWAVYRHQLIAGRKKPSNDTQVYFLRQEWDTCGVPVSVSRALAQHTSPTAISTSSPAQHEAQILPCHSSFDQGLTEAQNATLTLNHPTPAQTHHAPGEASGEASSEALSGACVQDERFDPIGQHNEDRLLSLPADQSPNREHLLALPPAPILIGSRWSSSSLVDDTSADPEHLLSDVDQHFRVDS